MPAHPAAQAAWRSDSFEFSRISPRNGISTECPARLAGMAQAAKQDDIEAQGEPPKAKMKAREQLELLLEKRRREDEIRQQLAAFAEEMEQARKRRGERG